MVILEGVSAGRLAVADRLSLLIWVETADAIRLARGLERDGEATREQWLRWMAEEDRHYAVDRAIDRADVVIDGAPHVAIERHPEHSFVVTRWSIG